MRAFPSTAMAVQVPSTNCPTRHRRRERCGCECEQPPSTHSTSLQSGEFGESSTGQLRKGHV
jgi:hypothetical protein